MKRIYPVLSGLGTRWCQSVLRDDLRRLRKATYGTLGLLAFVFLCSCSTGSRREGLGYVVPIHPSWSIPELAVSSRPTEWNVLVADEAIDAIPVISVGISKELSVGFAGRMRMSMHGDGTVEILDERNHRYVIGRWAWRAHQGAPDASQTADIELFGMVSNDWFSMWQGSKTMLCRFGYVRISLLCMVAENPGSAEPISVQFRDVKPGSPWVILARERVRSAFTHILWRSQSGNEGEGK